jgi:hypothetical protein
MFLNDAMHKRAHVLRCVLPGVASLALVFGSLGLLNQLASRLFRTHCESSRAKGCVANLKQLDSAKEQYAMDHKLNDGDRVPVGMLWAPGQ